MLSIHGLPPELGLLLLPLLLSPICEEIRSFTLPYFYRKTSWHLNGVHELDLYENVPPIHLLLRSLFRKPELGRLVEDVTFWGSHDDETSSKFPETPTLWAPEATPKLKKYELDAVMQCVERFGPTFRGSRRDYLLRGNIDVYVALILIFLPTFRSLWLSAGFVSNYRFLESLFQKALNIHPFRSFATHTFALCPFD
ncbi:hypothetical protein MMC21_006431 [Puttea exsequens]|nr:hypothetical protein [Puttea exsequens]